MPPIELVPWTPDDLALLQRLNEPLMTEHLGGPESHEKVVDRLRRYVIATTPSSRMFRIVIAGEAVGSIGYWERTWHDETVYETGWGVVPEHQGRGVASEALRELIPIARAERTHRYLEAFPAVSNAASNAICRKAGFELIGESKFEYPPGHLMRCNEWRFDLAHRESGEAERIPT